MTMDDPRPRYCIAPVTEDGRTVDLEIAFQSAPGVEPPCGDASVPDASSAPASGREGRRAPPLRLLGRGGASAEIRPAERAASGAPGLPVFLGAGFGHGVGWWLAHHDGPVAVMDAETDLAAWTGAARLAADPRVTWIGASTGGEASERPESGVRGPDPRAVLAALESWGAAEGGTRLLPVAHPAYLRLRPELYKVLLDSLNAVPARERGLSGQPFETSLGLASDSAPGAASGVSGGDPDGSGFWARARYRKFAGRTRRVLLFRRGYLLMNEIEAAARRGGVELHAVDVPASDHSSSAFVEDILREVLAFRPDFALTVNHFGIDREGALQDLLARLELPLASWFVDSPELILHDFAQGASRLVSPWTAIFCWDRDALPALRKRGFRHVAHLPLATDPELFRPGVRPAPGLAKDLESSVCFVGSSWLGRAAEQQAAGGLGPELTEGLDPVLAVLRAERGRRPAEVLAERFPKLHAALLDLDDPVRRMRYEQYLTWRATAAYRLDCVRALLPLRPLVVGDEGWRRMLPGEPGRDWRLHAPVPYRALPGLYGTATLNFNCTSLQMRSAVNQRVFDVPAAGGFLLSDNPGEMAELFEPGREAATFTDIVEIQDLAVRYLRDGPERRRIIEAGRARVLAQHTYGHRLHELCARMRRWYG